MLHIILLLALTAPPEADTLKTLPHVATLEAKPIDKPTHYIIHILDWHFVPKDAFIADLKDQGVTEGLDAAYAKHLDDVEAVQNEHKALLRAMVKNDGVTEVYVEGVTREDMPVYTARLNRLRSLGEKLRAFKELVKGIDVPELKADIAAQENTYRRELLPIGAAGQLHMEGMLKTLPADDQKTHDAARPVGKDGKVKWDKKAIEARESALVKIVLAGGPVSVLVLGGAHDLSDNVPEGVAYIRVGTKGYEAMAVKHTMPTP